MEKEVIPTEEQWLEWVNEQVAKMDIADNPENGDAIYTDWYKKHYPIERYQEILNQQRNQVIGILTDWVDSNSEIVDEIVDELDCRVAQCLVDLINHTSELETNLEEFQYLADEIPSVWAI
tara:strand:- start:252 stop:614 length:363 start_codon:yes stop_codon:yes gene_type:complete